MLSSVAQYGIELPCEALYGLVWYFIALFVIFCLYMAFFHGHKSKFIWSCSLLVFALNFK